MKDNLKIRPGLHLQDQSAVYIWSFYFACSVFTTVGFGEGSSHWRWFWTLWFVISLPGPAHPNLYLAVTWTVIAGDITARNTDERVIDSTISPISTSALDTTTFLNFGLFCLEISDELIFYHMMIHKYPKRIPVHIFLYYLMKIFAMILQVFVIFLMVISVGFFGTLLSQVSFFCFVQFIWIYSIVHSCWLSDNKAPRYAYPAKAGCLVRWRVLQLCFCTAPRRQVWFLFLGITSCHVVLMEKNLSRSCLCMQGSTTF